LRLIGGEVNQVRANLDAALIGVNARSAMGPSNHRQEAGSEQPEGCTAFFYHFQIFHDSVPSLDLIFVIEIQQVFLVALAGS
jgi:hypothetical protein